MSDLKDSPPVMQLPALLVWLSEELPGVPYTPISWLPDGEEQDGRDRCLTVEVSTVAPSHVHKQAPLLTSQSGQGCSAAWVLSHYSTRRGRHHGWDFSRWKVYGVFLLGVKEDCHGIQVAAYFLVPKLGNNTGLGEEISQEVQFQDAHAPISAAASRTEQLAPFCQAERCIFPHSDLTSPQNVSKICFPGDLLRVPHAPVHSVF